jgi:hypothetical protein
MHKVFKPKRKSDQMSAAYLYEDGHVVVCYDRREDIGDVSYAQIAQSIGIRTAFEGRIVFHNPALLVAIAGLPNPQVDCQPASVNRGSCKTKELGLPVGNLTVYSSVGYFGISWLPDILSSGLTYQPTDIEKYQPNLTRWGSGSCIDVSDKQEVAA